jgi:sec-independent protein translocase protein TatA
MDSPLLMLVLGAIAVLLFGERLPEVARSFGKGLMEVRNGMRGLQNEIEDAVKSATSTSALSSSIPSASPHEEPEEREEATAPKFEPPPAETKDAGSPAQPAAAAVAAQPAGKTAEA